MVFPGRIDGPQEQNLTVEYGRANPRVSAIGKHKEYLIRITIGIRMSPDLVIALLKQLFNDFEADAALRRQSLILGFIPMDSHRSQYRAMYGYCQYTRVPRLRA